MIVDLARTLELEVIAEGIETAEQLAALRELNAGLGQGYFLGRPSAAAPRPGAYRPLLEVLVGHARERPGDGEAGDAGDGTSRGARWSRSRRRRSPATGRR